MEKILVSITLFSPKSMVEMSYDDRIFWYEPSCLMEQIHAIWASRACDDNRIFRGDVIFLEKIFEHELYKIEKRIIVIPVKTGICLVFCLLWKPHYYFP